MEIKIIATDGPFVIGMIKIRVHQQINMNGTHSHLIGNVIPRAHPLHLNPCYETRQQVPILPISRGSRGRGYGKRESGVGCGGLR